MTFLQNLERDAEPVRDTVRASLENGTPLRLTAARTWLAAGRPVTQADEFAVTQSGIVEYVPGDFTITVKAGTSLADVARATAPNHQWLPLDPFGSTRGTIGATIATASSGPLAHAFGTPRDQVIGLGFVTGKGDYVRSGGRVVKNVAGFDLTRLLIGSWGTLGIITDATFRLRAVPERDLTLALVLSGDAVHFRRTMDEIGAAPLVAAALELLSPATARAIGQDGDTMLLVRLGGNSAAVNSQRETLARLGEIRELEPAVWDKLRAVEPADAAVARYSGPLAEFTALWRGAERDLASAGAYLHGTPLRGVVRCIVPAEHAHLLTRFAPDDGVQRVFERLPPGLWGSVAANAAGGLSRRVRDSFDPARLLNPGILGEADR